MKVDSEDFFGSVHVWRTSTYTVTLGRLFSSKFTRRTEVKKKYLPRLRKSKRIPEDPRLLAYTRSLDAGLLSRVLFSLERSTDAIGIGSGL